MTDYFHSNDGGPANYKGRRSSGASVTTNPYRGDQGRHPVAPVVTYAEAGPKSHVPGNEEIDNSCVVYVGGLTNVTDDGILYDTFRQFGTIVSLVRRSVNFDVRPTSTMTQYAFIGFSNSQDAQKAIKAGEVTVDNRKLIIKPRDKPGFSYHKNLSHNYHNSHASKDSKRRHVEESKDQILQLLQKNSHDMQPVPQVPTTYEEQQAQHVQQAQQNRQELRVQGQIEHHEQNMSAQSPPVRDPVTYYDVGNNAPTTGVRTSSAGISPMMFSKSLSVANVPFDMSPKELFNLFSEVGQVEGSFIFPYADMMNRRFGHVVMDSFYGAQKARETYDGHAIRGCTLEVAYKNPTDPDIPTTSPTAPYNIPYPQQPMPQPMQQPMQQQGFSQPFQQQFQPTFAVPPMYHPAFPNHPQQIAWVPQHYGSTPPGLVGPGMMPFAHQFPPYPNMLPFHHFNTMGPMSPPGFEGYQNSVSPSTSPSYQNFPNLNPTWQGQIQAPGKHSQAGRPYTPRRHNGRMNGRNCLSNKPPPPLPGHEPHIRSVSDSSSMTLVSSVYEKPKFDGPIVKEPYRSPLIVNGSYPRSCETPSHNSFTSDSDKDSTPSPVVVRPAPDSQFSHETPTKPSATPAFEVLTASTIPETSQPADPANLYIKNLDDTIISDAEDLKLLFVPFGPVASAYLSTYPGSIISRGYGFVAFVKKEDAAAAKAKLDGTVVGRKRVFVTYAERKEDRIQRLKGFFNGDKGEPDKEGIEKKEEKSQRETEISDITDVSDHAKTNEQEIVRLSTDTSEANAEDSVEEVVEENVQEITSAHGTQIPPIIAEQEITVTTRWRGKTQLTGIVEASDEEDTSRVMAIEDVNSRSFNLAYAQPCIIPSSNLQETSDNNLLPQNITLQPSNIQEQCVSAVSSLSETASTSTNESQHGRVNHRLSRQGGQHNQHHKYPNYFPNHSSGDHVNARGGYFPQNQGYYQNNGNGNGCNGGGRPLYKNINGNYGSTKSMLPVPSGSNGAVQIAPSFMTPTGPRTPYYTGSQQQFYPTYPNNEPIGQSYQGKKNKKNSGRGRARDNNFSGHQTRAQNTQMTGGMVGKVEMVAAAF